MGYAEGKTVDQVVAITGRFIEHEHVCPLRPRLGTSRPRRWPAPWTARRWTTTRAAGTWSCGRVAPQPEVRGAVGLLAAGTSDVAVAGEAVAMIRAMAVDALTAFDVGVAGLHRLSGPLEEMRAAGVGAIVVAAGMEGALPSVVAGLVAVPVIGLPTSSGYGTGVVAKRR